MLKRSVCFVPSSALLSRNYNTQLTPTKPHVSVLHLLSEERPRNPILSGGLMFNSKLSLFGADIAHAKTRPVAFWGLSAIRLEPCAFVRCRQRWFDSTANSADS